MDVVVKENQRLSLRNANSARLLEPNKECKMLIVLLEPNKEYKMLIVLQELNKEYNFFIVLLELNKEYKMLIVQTQNLYCL